MSTYTYDDRNRLTNVTVGGTVVATYTYDALNRRIGFDENGTQTWTVYDGQNPYADFDGSGTLEERYLYGAAIDQILARTSSGVTTAWYLTDKQGTIRDIVDTSGNELDHLVYDSFGNVVSETNATNGDRFKYIGMQGDAIAALDFDNARYYYPIAGEFTSQDPEGIKINNINLYLYVNNDPNDFTDQTGADATPSMQDMNIHMMDWTKVADEAVAEATRAALQATVVPGGFEQKLNTTIDNINNWYLKKNSAMKDPNLTPFMRKMNSWMALQALEAEGHLGALNTQLKNSMIKSTKQMTEFTKKANLKFSTMMNWVTNTMQKEMDAEALAQEKAVKKELQDLIDQMTKMTRMLNK